MSDYKQNKRNFKSREKYELKTSKASVERKLGELKELSMYKID